MTKILVTGSNGQLGSDLRVLSAEHPEWQFIFTDVAELDITNAAMVDQKFASEKPNYVINCAAYTAVDKAETELELATKINADAPAILSAAAKKYGARYIHISTDYVFDGCGHRPYTEDMPTGPVSAYGRTKLQGEQMAAAANAETVIIRTAWLYSSFGNNFVKTMIRLGKERADLGVIFDQIGTPTWARDLARAILAVVAQGEAQKDGFVPGIYHFSNEGVCSWYDFAKQIHQFAGITTCAVRPLETREYPTPAARPHYSVFNKTKIKTTYHITIPHWKDSLEACMKLL